jgi:hypothetical protein
LEGVLGYVDCLAWSLEAIFDIESLIKFNYCYNFVKEGDLTKRMKIVSVGVVLVFSMFALMLLLPELFPIADEEQLSPTLETTTIDYAVLKEWHPDEDPQNIGLEILISENDATKENIVDLVKELSKDAPLVIIGIYQDQQAWEILTTWRWSEEMPAELEDIIARGLLAHYIKYDPDDLNEVRWFQERGQLEDLFETGTQVD